MQVFHFYYVKITFFYKIDFFVFFDSLQKFFLARRMKIFSRRGCAGFFVDTAVRKKESGQKAIFDRILYNSQVRNPLAKDT